MTFELASHAVRAAQHLARGIEWELYADHILYVAVCAGQRIASVRVPLVNGSMTGECEAISYLADALDVVDPPRHRLGERPYLRLVSDGPAPPARR